MFTARNLRIGARILASLACLLFLATTFRAAWQSPSPDFPSYYTGAKALLEGDRLRDFYDWTWFKRAMSRAGIDDQLGVWVPQTPLTMLPFVPLAPFAPQTARRIWIVAGLALLVATLWILSRLTAIRFACLILLASLCCVPLHMNFILGQYYVLLLFLLTLSCYCLERSRPVAAGVLCGVAFGLKLYGAPFLLYFAVRRNWRAVAGMGAAAVGAIVLAIVFFGWNEVAWYAASILPRTLDGGSVDPYHPALASLSTMLRRAFMAEPEFNPYPLLNAPWLFFFLRAFSLLAVIGYALLALGKSAGMPERRAFAWFTIVVLLLSPSTPHYTFVLLLLPVPLLLEEAPPRRRILLLAWLALMSMNLPFANLFPKVWLLLLVWLLYGFGNWRTASLRWIAVVGIAALGLAALDARHRMAAWLQEPAARFQPFAIEKGRIFSGFPAVTAAGVFYQAMGERRYELHWAHDGIIEHLHFPANALCPVALAPGGPVQFEFLARGVSRFMVFHPRTRTVTAQLAPHPVSPADLSPDGKWKALASLAEGTRQILLLNTASGRIQALTGGQCNNSSPVWTLDSSALIFASDCGRGLGAPALYRAPVPAAP